MSTIPDFHALQEFVEAREGELKAALAPQFRVQMSYPSNFIRVRGQFVIRAEFPVPRGTKLGDYTPTANSVEHVLREIASEEAPGHDASFMWLANGITVTLQPRP